MLVPQMHPLTIPQQLQPLNTNLPLASQTQVFFQNQPYQDYRPTTTATVTAFTTQSGVLPMPTQIDENLFFTVGFGFFNSNPGPQCQGPNNTRFAASMNNVSFVLLRTTSLLQAYYQGIPSVFTTDLPAVPPIKFDYAGNVSPNCGNQIRGLSSTK